jgi:nucleoid DNA-binding protein
MQLISTYIGDLLLWQESIVVPNFGGFVARQMPARFSEKKDKLLPPYKQLLFHTHLNLSDGVFERYVANRAQLSLDAASSLIQNTVSDWQAQLKNGERIEIDRVGLLFLDEERKLRFEQDRHHNLLLQSFGLGEVQFDVKEEKPVHVAQPEPVIHVQVEKTLAPEPAAIIIPIVGESIEKLASEQDKVVLAQDAVSYSKSNKSIWLKVAAAAVVLPFLFYSFWVPLTTDVLQTKKIAVADFNPFHQSPPAQYKSSVISQESTTEEPITNLESIVEALPEDVNSFNFNYDDELVFAVKLNRTAPQNNTEEEVIIQASSQVHTVHLISGCFGLKENAENHMNALRGQGLSPYIVDVQGGLHRVAAAGSNDSGQAAKLAAQLKEQGVDTWTLKK